MPSIHKNREAWLMLVAQGIKPLVEKAAEAKVPKFRVSMSFPSHRALSNKKRVVGQCWPGVSSGDGVVELLISPVHDDPMDIAGTIAHEMVHAAVGCEHGHKKPFWDVARRVGLIGTPASTDPGPEFIERVQPIIKSVGFKLPHSPLKANKTYQPQKTYLLKAECVKSGYCVRITRTWVDECGAPICPCCKVEMVMEEAE